MAFQKLSKTLADVRGMGTWQPYANYPTINERLHPINARLRPITSH